MALRFQFLNEFLPALIIDDADPIGVNELTQTLKRSAENEGITFEVILDLDFIKKGRRYLKQAFENHGGIDAEVLINIYQYNTNARKWRLYANGRVNFNKYDVYEDRLTVNMEQVGFQRRVLNLLDTDVNIETTTSDNGTAIPETITHDVPYHSKTIVKRTLAYPQDSNEAQFLNVGKVTIPFETRPADFTTYLAWRNGIFPFNEPHPRRIGRDILFFGSIDTQKSKFEELQQFFKVPYSYIQGDNMQDTTSQTTGAYTTYLQTYKEGRFEVYKADEDGTINVDIFINMRHSLNATGTKGETNAGCGSSITPLGNTEILYWFEVRDTADNIVWIENIDRLDLSCGMYEAGYIQQVYSRNGLYVQQGYKIYFYHTVRIYGNYLRPDGIQNGLISYDLIIQNSNPVWDALTSYGLGDKVVYNAGVWESSRDKNIGLTPSNATTFWTYLQPWTGQPDSTSISISSATTAPVTTAKTILLYDVFLKCCQFITNEIDCFKSDLLGRTELGYLVDGDGALIGWTNGGNLRKLPNKKIFANLKDLVDFTDALLCVGFGFETDNGRSILRLERKSFFYNKSQSVISLGKVYKVKRRLDQKRFYKEIEYGYIGKIDIGKINAIDEFNTLRRASTPIKNTKNKLRISTKIRTSGYQIEAQRRLQFSTADSKLDDENFAIVLIREGAGFRTKRNEGYITILNVIDPQSGYNYDISPARCLKNWYEYLASIMVRSTNKKLKFAYGEVNYIMASQKVGETELLREDGEFDLSNVIPLFEPMLYSFDKVKVTGDQWQLIKSMPYGVIDFEDQYGERFEGFLSDKGIEHDSFNDTGDFELLHVYRP